MTAGRILRTILGLRWRLALRSESDDAIKVIAGIVVVGAAAFALWLSTVVFRAVDSRIDAGAEALLLGMAAGVGTFQVVAALRWSVERLYLASDLDLYLAAPIPHGTLLGAKIVETAVSSPISSLALVVAVSGFGIALGSAWAVPFLIAAVVVLALATAAVGLTVGMLLGRIVPPRHLRTIATAAPAVVGVAFAFGGSAVGSAFASREVATDVEGMLEGLRAGLLAVPASWPMLTVTRAIEGDLGLAVLNLGLVVASTAGIGASAYAVFRNTFYRTRSAVTEAPARRVRGSVGERLLPFLTPEIRAIVLKDWRTARRDLRVLMGLFMPIVFAGYVAVTSLSDAGGSRPVWLLFIVPMMLGGPAFQLVAMEGRNISLLRILPLSGAQVFGGKLAASVLPTLLVMWTATLILGTVTDASLLEIVGIGLLGAWLALGVMVLHTALAASKTDFRSDKQRPDVFAGLLAGFGSVVFSASSVGVAAAAVASMDAPVRAAIGLGSAVVCGVVSWLIVRAARRGITRLDRLAAI